MEIEERVERVESGVGGLENREDLIEQAIFQMRDILLRHHDPLDEYFKALSESRENFDFKLIALIDAQMKNEIEIADLNDASRAQLKRIENLENN